MVFKGINLQQDINSGVIMKLIMKSASKKMTGNKAKSVK